MRITDLVDVGPKTAAALAALGISSALDLLQTFPFRYEDLRFATPSSQAKIGEGEQNFVGTVVAIKERRVRDLEIVEARLQDDHGTLTAKWIGRRRYIVGRLKAGMRLFVRGRFEPQKMGDAAVNVTLWRALGEEEEYHGSLVPVYRATKEISSRKIGHVIARNLATLLDLAGDDVLPRSLAHSNRYGTLTDAYRAVHAPETLESAHHARERFVYAEFLSMAVAAELRRAERERDHDAPAMVISELLLAEFQASLPFPLTRAQCRVIKELWSDQAREVPMNRMLQGDVGSGKTLVAAAAIVLAARNGVQSALMAPTEVLAAQHAAKLAPLLLPLGITVDAVFGSQSARSRAGASDRIASGQALLAIGTHALITDGIEFARLGLVIIDEQHRFGVAQRAKLRSKGGSPHTLHMTATPIPRTLSQTYNADLDISTIDELPPGRTPIETFVVRASRMERVERFIRANVARGQQAYIVAPAIAESDAGLTSAVEVAQRLSTETFADLRVGLLHGKLAAREKDSVMERFASGNLDVLVATTVIEVGIDVANASVMVVLDAQRFGLAQLHQLRGRVGRGAAKSFCILVADDDEENARLSVLARTNDGFEIAEADLALRGPGEFAGTAQSGTSGLRFGDLRDDIAIYKRAKIAARALLNDDPQLVHPEHQGLRSAVDAAPTAQGLLTSS